MRLISESVRVELFQDAINSEVVRLLGALRLILPTR
jgi:hypothetical protein